jgi:hypothetical protein
MTGKLVAKRFDFINMVLSHKAQDVIHEFPATKPGIPSLLPVGEVGGLGLLPCRLGGRMVSGRRFDLVQNVEGCPRFSHMTKWAVTRNRPHDFRPSFIVPFELKQGPGDVVTSGPFPQQIPQVNVNIRCLTVKGHGLFRSAQMIRIKIP